MEEVVVTEVVTLMEGALSYYRGGQFKGERMVMLQRWENDNTAVVFNGGRMVMLRNCNFNGGRMVMSQRWPV